jgi:heme-degrading monooxygenase HmoA
MKQRKERIVIARYWRGWTEPQDADAYETLLKDTVLPGLRGMEGYRGGYIFRRDEPEEVEFVVVNFFISLESVKRFAGSDYNIPVFEPEAKKLLRRVESVATHYEVRANTIQR